MRGNKEVNIVIFDDVRENLYELASIVDELGFTAKPVLNVRQAIRALSMGNVALLILDVAMPEMSGFEFYRKMYGEPFMEGVSILFVSAYQDLQTKEEAFSLGAFDYIVRPFEKRECAVRIREAARHAMQYKVVQSQKQQMQQFLIRKTAENEKNKRRIVEGMITVLKDQEPTPRHFKRLCEDMEHFLKGISVVPEFDGLITDAYIDQLVTVAPLYRIGVIPGGSRKLPWMHGIENENEYIRMAVEIAEYFYVPFSRNHRVPISAQMVSMVVSWDLFHGNIYEYMERLEDCSGDRYHPALVRAFRVIQLPYYLDKGSK